MARAPVGVALADHAGDEIDVDLREVEPPRLPVDPVDLRRAVGASIELENSIVEVLDSQAEPRHAELAQRGELRIAERARLALEGDFRGLGSSLSRL